MSKKGGDNPFFGMLGLLLVPAIVFSVVISNNPLNRKIENSVKETQVAVESEAASADFLFAESTNSSDSEILFESIKEVESKSSTEPVNQDISQVESIDPSLEPSKEIPIKQVNSAILTAADVPAYTGADEIILNGGKSTFTVAELQYDGVGWAVYGNLDEWNRVTTMNAMVTPDMYDTGTDADSRILPSGWKKSGQNEGNPEQLNRGHLLADVLGGSGEDWRNLVTLYRNANYPTMYFAAEDIVNTAIQHGSVVRYRVTPIFMGEELMCEGLHIMAKSVTDNSVDLNVYVFNEPKDGID
ncbi:dna/rna non-specific endonuclease [Trichococcus palustris]|uniref:Dna/rna non-specific endonuclease n=1 Tax=Trichococcus palustris TaxID=140314 RepID=A0A143Y807_9LACT|nr:DNA/RNA non-specific endonuclease [Trichococcus palustris]CZQ81790.1 dna/rna non-specific endonuclease [Trichococcus palustris]SFK61743.1 DNA/RNA non-specific endonuclease [Trichococcus palustris]